MPEASLFPSSARLIFAHLSLLHPLRLVVVSVTRGYTGLDLFREELDTGLLSSYVGAWRGAGLTVVEVGRLFRVSRGRFRFLPLGE